MGLGLVRTDDVVTGFSTVTLIICPWSTKIGQIHIFIAMISPARTKLETRIIHRPGHKRRGDNHCDIDTPSMTMVHQKKDLK